MPPALLPIFLIVVVDILGMTIMYPLLTVLRRALWRRSGGRGDAYLGVRAVPVVRGPNAWTPFRSHRTQASASLSQVGTLFGFILLALANSLWLIFLSRIVDGFTAGNISLAQAYIADVTKPEERTKSFAVIGIAFGVGFLIGPAISGFLAQYSYRYPIYAAMALSATSIVATALCFPRTSLRPKARARDGSAFLPGVVTRNSSAGRHFPRCLWQFFAFIFCFSTFMAGFPLFAERRFTWEGAHSGRKRSAISTPMWACSE